VPGIQELFSAFIEATLLDGPDPVLRTESSAVAAASSPWDIREHRVGSDVGAGTLRYLDDRGVRVEAMLVGKRFLISPAGEEAGIWSDELRFTDWGGKPLRARRNGTAFQLSDSTSTYLGNHLPVLDHDRERVHASSGKTNPSTVNPKRLEGFIVKPPHGGAMGEYTLAYKAWNGSNWTVRISEQRFLTHTAEQAGLQISNNTINFLGWDGAKWTAVLDPEAGTFVQTRIGSHVQRRSPNLHFKGWDNDNWSANLR
jgi:hypothetical protein